MKSFLIKNSLYLLSIIFIAAFLRFWQLGNNPPGLYWDEASIGYNAYSILKTAKDEYGSFLPLTFRSLDDYKPPVYIYTTALSVAVFGLSEFAVRFPAALFGTLTVLTTYFTAFGLFKSRAIALASAFLLAVSPWHIQFSRGGFEAGLMVFFCSLGLVLFLYFPRKFDMLLASIIFFGLALNTYHGAKIWVPLFIGNIFFWYKSKILVHRFKLVLAVFLFLIFLLPILLSFKDSLLRGKSVSIFAQKEKRLETFITGYLSHFAPNFLFVSGDLNGRHAVSGMGHLYVFEIPLIILGIISLLRLKNTGFKFIVGWLLLAPIPAAFSTPTPHALRAITFLPVWSLIAALGLNFLAKAKIQPKIKYSFVIALIAIGIYNLLTYFHLYYKHYYKEKAPDWQDGYREMVNYVDSLKDNYETMAITDYYGSAYLYTLFYTKYDPSLYQTEPDGKRGFANFEFFGESWEKKTTGKVLVVRPKWQIPNPPPHYLKYIYSVNGDLVFRISEE